MNSFPLSLRCTDRLVPVTAPNLAAFASGARLADPARDDVMSWLAPTTPTPDTGGLRRRPRLAGIPAAEPAALDVSAFALGLRPSLPAPSPRLLAFAAAVPLALSPAMATAQDDAEATEEADLGEEAKTQPPDATSVPIEPADPNDLSYLGVPLWDAVQGERVRLLLDESLEATGVVVAQAPGEIAIAREPDGVVMRIPKALVMKLQILPSLTPAAPGLFPFEDPRKNRPPPSGQGLAAVGGILTGIGAGLMTTFAVGTAVDSSFSYYTFPMMFIGPALLGPGIPLLTAGLVREGKRAEWRLEKEREKLNLSIGPTLDGGWSGRVSLRW